MHLLPFLLLNEVLTSPPYDKCQKETLLDVIGAFERGPGSFIEAIRRNPRIHNRVMLENVTNFEPQHFQDSSRSSRLQHGSRHCQIASWKL